MTHSLHFVEYKTPSAELDYALTQTQKCSVHGSDSVEDAIQKFLDSNPRFTRSDVVTAWKV